jgi:hypothetical protein
VGCPASRAPRTLRAPLVLVETLQTSSDGSKRRGVQVRNFVLGALAGVVLIGAGLWLVRLGDTRETLSLPVGEPLNARTGAAANRDVLAVAGQQGQTAAPGAFVETGREGDAVTETGSAPATTPLGPASTSTALASTQLPQATAAAPVPTSLQDAGVDTQLQDEAEDEAPDSGLVNLEELPKAVLDRGYTYCGSMTCNVGMKCCCEACIPHDAACEPAWCNFGTLSVSVPCGLNTCTAGDVCCNPSCGICTRAGESCSTAVCD